MESNIFIVRAYLGVSIPQEIISSCEIACINEMDNMKWAYEKNISILESSGRKIGGRKIVHSWKKMEHLLLWKFKRLEIWTRVKVFLSCFNVFLNWLLYFEISCRSWLRLPLTIGKGTFINEALENCMYHYSNNNQRKRHALFQKMGVSSQPPSLDWSEFLKILLTWLNQYRKNIESTSYAKMFRRLKIIKYITSKTISSVVMRRCWNWCLGFIDIGTIIWNHFSWKWQVDTCYKIKNSYRIKENRTKNVIDTIALHACIVSLNRNNLFLFIS